MSEKRRSKDKSAGARKRINAILEKSAGAVVYHRGDDIEYLLIYSHYWEFPKGHIDPQESEVDAARREVREETGLQVELDPAFRKELDYFYRRGNRLVKKQVVYFLGLSNSHEVKLSWEHTEWVWLAFEQAWQRLTYSGSRQILAQAHEFLQGKLSREGNTE